MAAASKQLKEPKRGPRSGHSAHEEVAPVSGQTANPAANRVERFLAARVDIASIAPNSVDPRAA